MKNYLKHQLMSDQNYIEIILYGIPEGETTPKNRVTGIFKF